MGLFLLFSDDVQPQYLSGANKQKQLKKKRQGTQLWVSKNFMSISHFDLVFNEKCGSMNISKLSISENADFDFQMKM